MESLPPTTPWRVMLGYARQYWLALVGGGLLSLATSATGLALPLVVRELIDGLGTGGTVTTLLLLMTGLVLANAAIGAVGSFVLERTGESVVLTARFRRRSSPCSPSAAPGPPPGPSTWGRWSPSCSTCTT